MHPFVDDLVAKVKSFPAQVWRATKTKAVAAADAVMEIILSNVLRALLIVAVVTFLCGAFAGSAIADEATPPVEKTVYAELFEAAQKYSGYSCDAFTDQNFRDHYCHEIQVRVVTLPDGVLGMFLPENATEILVSEDMVPGSPQWKNTVMHEYVHYLQWLFGYLTPAGMTCEKMVDIEEEAYTADRAYGNSVGFAQPDAGLYLVTRRMACGEPM